MEITLIDCVITVAFFTIGGIVDYINVRKGD